MSEWRGRGQGACVRVRVCVCVCMKERERERESITCRAGRRREKRTIKKVVGGEMNRHLTL